MTRWPAVMAMTGLVLAGCQTSQRRLWQASPAELAGVAGQAICESYAIALMERQSTPLLENEVARRGLDCRDEIALWDVRCPMLRIVDHRPAGSGVIYTVRNLAREPMGFRIAYRRIQSELLQIAPGATQQYPVAAASPLIGDIANALSHGNSAPPELNECFPIRW